MASFAAVMGEDSHAYFYRPGMREAEGMRERGARSRVAPYGIATNTIEFRTMQEYDVYAGSSRSIRRNGRRKLPPPASVKEPTQETKEYQAKWNALQEASSKGESGKT